MSKIRPKNKKIMNKSTLGLVIVSIFVAMTFTGCIGQEQKRILRIGHDHEPGLIDPARFTWSSDHAIISNIYSYLIGFEPGTFNMVGDLAKEVPSVENGLISPNGLTITFEIRIGIKWHPGIPGTPYAGKDYGEVTAHDVVYTIERLKGMHDLAPHEVIYGAAFKNIEKVEAVDNYTVIFHLHQFDVGLLWNLAPNRNGAIINKQAIEDYGEEYWKYPIGSGPFKFVSWTSSNEFVIIKHNDYYRTEPWLDQIIYIPYANEIDRYNALTRDEIDICSPETLELWLMANRNHDIEIAARLGLKTVGLSFNFEWMAPDGRKPLADVRVRQAIAYATNKMEIADQLLGGIHTEAVGLLNSNYVGSIKKEDLPSEYLYPYNITKAKILLAEAGYPYGINLIFHGMTLPNYEVIPLLLKKQWERANIHLRIVLEEISDWTKRMFIDADYCVGWLILSPRPPEPLGVFKTMFHTVSETFGLNYAKYSNPETDTLIDQAAVILDENTRYDFYKQIQINIMRDLPTYPLWWETTFFVHQKTVKNIYVDLFHAYGDWMEEAIIEE